MSNRRRSSILDFKIVIIPKEVLNAEDDQYLYLYKYIVSTKPLVLLFWDDNHEYFVYHKKFDFDLKPYASIVKAHIEKRFLNYK